MSRRTFPTSSARFPEIQLDFHLTDSFVDIIRDGFDVAIRIGELPDSSLVARKLSPDRRVICAAPSYLEKAGEPRTLADLDAPQLPVGQRPGRVAARGAGGAAPHPRQGQHALELGRAHPRRADRRARPRPPEHVGDRRRACRAAP